MVDRLAIIQALRSLTVTLSHRIPCSLILVSNVHIFYLNDLLNESTCSYASNGNDSTQDRQLSVSSLNVSGSAGRCKSRLEDSNLQFDHL